MQFESLKIYCDLAETESFTKAAELNGVTQSAVSQMVSSMERQFKSLLIERSKKQFRITREGQALYEGSKKMLATYAALEQRLEEVRHTVSGIIQLATIYSIGLYELPAYIKAFLHAHPTVKVRVEYRHDNDVYGDVLSNVVDLGLVAYPAKDGRLVTVPLRSDELVLICHPDHPFAKLKSLKLKALAKEKFVHFDPVVPMRKALDALLRKQGVKVESVMELENIEIVKRAVEIEAGVSIVPAATVKLEVEKQTLAALRITDPGMTRPLALIHKKQKSLSPAMKEFVALLQQPLQAQA